MRFSGAVRESHFQATTSNGPSPLPPEKPVLQRGSQSSPFGHYPPQFPQDSVSAEKTHFAKNVNLPPSVAKPECWRSVECPTALFDKFPRLLRFARILTMSMETGRASKGWAGCSLLKFRYFSWKGAAYEEVSLQRPSEKAARIRYSSTSDSLNWTKMGQDKLINRKILSFYFKNTVIYSFKSRIETLRLMTCFSPRQRW